jgi:hypothetical protein
MITMEKLSLEFKTLKQHFNKQMQSNLRVWKNLTKCNKADCFITPFGMDELSNQVWATFEMGFKLDIPLSKNQGDFEIRDISIIFAEIYSNLDPP